MFGIDPIGHLQRALESQVATTRLAVRLGRKLRERHQIKTRQPLSKVTIVHHDATVRGALEDQSIRLVGRIESPSEFAQIVVRRRGEDARASLWPAARPRQEGCARRM